ADAAPAHVSSAERRPAPRAPLFPYTTLFRSRETRIISSITRHTWRTRRASCLASFFARSSATRRRTRSTGGGCIWAKWSVWATRSEEHTSELQSRENRVCRLLLEKK